jgi:hypothetical protein
MIDTTNSQSGKHLSASLKVALGIAVLSLVALTAEQPRLSASTKTASVTDESVYFSNVRSVTDAATGTDASTADALVKSPSDGPDTTFPSHLFAP